MLVYFRTDASKHIGIGHIMRCIAIAEVLKKRHADVCFICNKSEKNIQKILEEHDIKVYFIDSQKCGKSLTDDKSLIDTTIDFEKTKNILSNKKNKIDWMIIDHYLIGKKWQSAVRKYANKVMVIDDLANRSYDCDLLLDQNFHEHMDLRYDHLTPPRCIKLLGPKFALIRTEFNKIENNLRKRDYIINRILISFGGADPNNDTIKSLKAIVSLKLPNIIIDVVVSDSNKNKDLVEEFSSAYPFIYIKYDVSNISEMMNNADLAIGAGGITMWERCLMGLPSIVISVAINQEESAEFLAKNGYIVYIGKSIDVTVELICVTLKFLISNPFFLKYLSTNCKQLVDGNGVNRVVNCLFKNIDIQLRVATRSDNENIFRWRNSKEIREYSFDQSEIDKDVHNNWLESMLINNNTKILIGEIGKEQIGVLRYDFYKTEAKISVYVLPEKHGMGYGATLIEAGTKWIKQNCDGVQTIKAEIISGNTRSEKVFVKAGYKLNKLTYIKKIDK